MKRIYKKFLENLLKKSGKISLTDRSRLKILKRSNSKGFVTNVDEKIGKFIFSKIIEKFPLDSLECEDGVYRKKGVSNRVWYIDPLDGTTNFIHGLPFYAISISCVDKQKSDFLVSGVYIPFFNQLFIAQGKHEVIFNDKKIKVSKIKKLKDALILSGFSFKLKNGGKEVKSFIRISSVSVGTRRSGSAAIDLCYVAAGFADGYFHYNLKPWDIAAGCHLVRNAGGLVNNIGSNKPPDLYNGTILASNRLIHKELSLQLANF